ncbi:peptidase S28 [Xylariaceae sp. FL1019]|nr:peptidase S28 [Xylariaceae sp. FL1019]
MKLLPLVLGLLCQVAVAPARILPPRFQGGRGLHARATAVTGNHTAYYFEQKIDHFPRSSRYPSHTKKTFQQRYYVDTSYYKPGGPVFLYLAGEGAIDNDSHLDNSLITHFMQQFGGIGVVLENRFYGTSIPFGNATTDDLLYLTTEQVIADHDVFARTVKLPGVSDINAPDTPWITYGGSYPGALSAFTIKTYPDTFLGGISSSGVIHGTLGYPEWYAPIQLLAPQDCVASINNIVDNIDSVIESKNHAAIKELKTIFGLGDLKDIRDFAQTIAFPIGGPFYYPTSTWQEINWNPNYGHQDFFEFCTNVTNVDAPANVTAVDHALAKYTKGKAWKNLGNYADYVKRVVLPLCTNGDVNSPECFGTQNPDWWADPTPGAERSYLYTTCTEFGAYQAAYPKGQKSLISRVIDTDYTQQWCNWAFPKGKYNKIPKTPDLDRWNVYGDFNFTADRLLFLDGTGDPWRDLCYHSTQAPQRYWTDEHPEHLISGAHHVWDLRTYSNVDDEPQFVRATTKLQLRTVETWLKDFNNHTIAMF